MYANYYKNFKKFIKNFSKIKSNPLILITISGGQDSLCLMRLVNNYISNNHLLIDVHYLYVDHQWTNDSLEHIEHLINYLKYYKYKLFIYQISQLQFTESFARKYRYKIITQHAINYQCNLILTGHNKTDKIETFFLNLLRGTGIHGATSLHLFNKLNQQQYIFRPLLYLNKYYLSWLCKKYYLPIWSDTTNYNYSIKRNRIRYELMKYLQNYFNYDIENHIISFIECLNQDNEYIKQNAIKLYYKNRHTDYIALNYQITKVQNYALKKRLIQLFLYHNLNKIIDQHTILEILKLMNLPKYNKKKIKYFFFQLNFNHEWLYITFV